LATFITEDPDPPLSAFTTLAKRENILEISPTEQFKVYLNTVHGIAVFEFELFLNMCY
jgi:hypothetical protein